MKFVVILDLFSPYFFWGYQDLVKTIYFILPTLCWLVHVEL